MVKTHYGNVYEIYKGNDRISKIYKGGNLLYTREFKPDLTNPWDLPAYDDCVYIKMETPAKSFTLQTRGSFEWPSRGGADFFDHVEIWGASGLIRQYTAWPTSMSFVNLDSDYITLQIYFNDTWNSTRIYGKTESTPYYNFISYGTQQEIYGLDGVNSYQNKYITEIYIGDNSKVDFLGGLTFQGCDKLKKIRLSNKITTLNSAQLISGEDIKGVVGPFHACRGLEMVDLRNCTKLDYIGALTFTGCTSLKKVILPPNLQKMLNVFGGCESLQEVVFTSEEPPKLANYFSSVEESGRSIFYNTPDSLVLKVPPQSIYKYKNYDVYKDHPIVAYTKADFE